MFLGSGEVSADVGEYVGLPVAVEADVSRWVDGCDHGVGDDLSSNEVEVRCVGSSGGARVHSEIATFVADFGVDDGDVQQHCSDSRRW